MEDRINRDDHNLGTQGIQPSRMRGLSVSRVTEIRDWDFNTTPISPETPRSALQSPGGHARSHTINTTADHPTDHAPRTRRASMLDLPRSAFIVDSNYSDLPEVVEAIPPSWDAGTNNKMPVISDDASEKIATAEAAETQVTAESPVPVSVRSPSLRDPSPAYPSHLKFRASNLSTEPLTKNSVFHDQMQVQDDGTRAQTVCGMSSRVFMRVSICLLVFVLALLATVLAVSLAIHGKRSSNGSLKPASSGRLSIHDKSQLAAVNWTEVNTGVVRSAVFFQDSESSIMVSLRDSLSNAWFYSNVTKALLNSTGAGALDVLSGTPLAAATNSYQVSLYYLTNDHRVSEIWSSDVISEVWYAGELGNNLAPQAMEGSKLSSFWQICTNCTNSLFLAFQEPTGRIQLCNLTNIWEYAGPIGTASRLPVNGTGLAIRPFSTPEGRYGTLDKSLGIYYVDSAGQVAEVTHGPETGLFWKESNISTTLSSAAGTKSSNSPGLAAASFGDHGWTNRMVSHVRSDGTIESGYWNGVAWTKGTPNLMSSPTAPNSFRAITMAQNRMAYALADGAVYEYQLDKADPLTWIYKSNVATK